MVKNKLGQLSPLVHLNGSGADHLRETYTAVHSSLLDTLAALYRATPNERDYYLLGHDAFPLAVKEHKARETRIREVLKEVEALLEDVMDQQDARRIRRTS